MMTYKVKLVSQPHAIAFVIVVLICIFTEAAIFFPLSNQSLAIPLTVLEFALAIFLWQKFVTGRTEWTVDNDRVIVSWTKKFAFSKLQDYVFEWKNIEKLWKGMDPSYYNLKFKFSSGETITFYHASFANDDFSDLIKVLYQTFEDKKKLQPT
jgi:hypothetical protein